MKRERPEKDAARVEDILDAADRIASYIEGKGFDDFTSAPTLADSVIYRLAIIGEAASKLTSAFKAARPDVNWRDAVGLRNFVVHEYRHVTPRVIWETCTRDVPALAAYLRLHHR